MDSQKTQETVIKFLHPAEMVDNGRSTQAMSVR